MFRRLMLLAFAAMALVTPSGCGYTLRPPFNREIKTVYVPMIKSNRFRRDINMQLTELIQQEIRSRTPYRVVGSPEGADAKIEGYITYDDKNIVVENPNNLPRHLIASMLCTVRFVDTRTGAATSRSTVIPAAAIGEAAPFYPEIGETASLGFQKVMKRVAKDIVGMMEDPWGDEYRIDIDAPPLPDPADEAEAEEPKTKRKA